MKPKHGKISIPIIIAVLVVTALLIMNTFGGSIKKAFAAVTDPLLKKVGLEEDDSEQQVVEQELLENAKKAFSEFKNIIEQCKNGKDLKCGCGQMDFTKLNKYSILLSSNNKATKNSFLALLDSKGLPVYAPTPIDNFPTLPEDIYESKDKFEEYKINNNQLIFSLKEIRYNIPEKEDKRFEWKMQNIHFSKPVLEVTIFNDDMIQPCGNKCPAFTFCAAYSQIQCNDCRASKDNDCQWTDYSDAADECGNPNRAPALIIKIDTEHDVAEAWDFRLTSNKNSNVGDVQFKLDNFNYKKDGKETCTVFAVEEVEGEGDNAAIWHTKPGSLIEKRDIGRLWNGLIGTESDCQKCDDSGSFCANKCGNKNKASPDLSPVSSLPADDGKNRNTIGSEWYTSLGNDNCGSFSNTRCPLLGESSSNKKYFKPKYEILCDDDGYWNACNSDGKTAVATIDGTKRTYTCSNLNKWVNGPAKEAIGARILHVKLDPGGGSLEKWAFHLTDDKDLPIDDIDLRQREFKDSVDGRKVCNVYSVNEEGNEAADHLSTWYINPGGRIMTSPDANNMFKGIDGKIAGVKQDQGKKKGSPYTTGSDGHPEAIGGASYSTAVSNDRCGHNFHSCHLLERSGSGHEFTPKYELLCDNNGFWRVCEEYVNGNPIVAGEVTYKCQQQQSGRWVWR